MSVLFYQPKSADWYEEVLTQHLPEARAKVEELLAATIRNKHGCLETPTAGPRKVRFRGWQDRVYRFVYCVVNEVVPKAEQVVRHRCDNRRCINPTHLQFGTDWDNWNDHREFRANGVNFDLL